MTSAAPSECMLCVVAEWLEKERASPALTIETAMVAGACAGIAMGKYPEKIRICCKSHYESLRSFRDGMLKAWKVADH